MRHEWIRVTRGDMGVFEMRMKHLLLGAVATGLILPSSAAFAEDAEITVMARKQQESILKVPVVVTAIGELQIERAQIKDLTDVAKKTTGLQFGVASVESGNLVSLRGYGTNALDPGVDASVSLNVDGMQITQGMAYAVGFFDMQQVEILKGPQALFFGKASPAGVISVRSNDPGDEVEVIARTGYEFVAQEWRNELIFSAPLSETVGIRLAGLYDDYGGFFKNTATPGTPIGTALGGIALPPRFGETKSTMFRGTLVWEPSSDFSARLKVNLTRDSQLGSQPGQLIDCPEGAVSIFFSLNEDCRADRNVNIVGMNPLAFPGMTPFRGGLPAVFTRQKFGTLEMNYDISPALTLTSVTGYYWMKTWVDFNCSNSGQAASGCMTTKRLKRSDMTQELRLASDFGGPLNFSLGGFYQDGEITNDLVLPGNVALFGSPAFARLFDGTHDIDIKAISLFGQARFDITPEFEIAAGVRWTDEKRTSTPTSVDIFGAVTGVPGSIITNFLAEMPPLRARNLSPELTLTWTPTDDLTLFGSLKQAYKSGSYNIVLAASKGRPDSFDDEKIRGGEIGLKTRLANRQISFNIAGYYYKVSNMQVQVNLPFSGVVPVLTTLNAASAEIYGIDADFTYKPDSIEGLEFTAAVNYNHGRFSSFLNAPCNGGQTAAAGCNRTPKATAPGDLNSFIDPATGARFRFTERDLSGTRLARSPDWSGNIGVHYEMPVGSGLVMGIGADAQVSSKYLALLGVDSQPEIFQKAYAKLNFSLSIKDENRAWEVAFIGNNLTNKMTLSNVNKANYAGGVVLPGLISGGPALGSAGLAETAGTIDRGRELWIRLTFRPMLLNGGN